jgi:sn-glycerol 3-phosphate transport system substrate-binding protein
MMARSRGFLSAVTIAAALALSGAACGGGDDGGGADGNGNGSDGGTTVDPAECGLDAFADATKPIDITFWHTMTRANEEWLDEAVKAFHAAQDDVRVKLVDQPSYQDALTKYRAGLRTGDLPDLAHLEETTVQVILDSQSTIPMQACVDADDYDLSEFLPRATAYYSSGDVLQAMPWNISNPVLFYDAAAFRKAGLDPAKPPTTFDEVREYAQQIVDSGTASHGMALRVEPYIFEYLNAKSGSTLVNNGNGREARATAATLDTPVALEIWTWWRDMVEDGLALNTGSAPGNIDHMLAIGNHDAVMAFEASGVLGTVQQVLQSGEFTGVEVAAAPLPALEAGGGVPVGDGSLWIPSASEPEQRAAAWQFVKYLSSAEEQAALAVAGGYAPAREDAVEQPALQEKWTADPSFRAAYDQLLSGEVTDANVGSLIGDYQGVRNAVREGIEAMLHGTAPQQALERAQRDATARIVAYNERVGE